MEKAGWVGGREKEREKVCVLVQGGEWVCGSDGMRKIFHML